MDGDHEVAIKRNLEWFSEVLEWQFRNVFQSDSASGLVGMRNGGGLAKECLRREVELLLLALAWSLSVGS